MFRFGSDALSTTAKITDDQWRPIVATYDVPILRQMYLRRLRTILDEIL